MPHWVSLNHHLISTALLHPKFIQVLVKEQIQQYSPLQLLYPPFQNSVAHLLLPCLLTIVVTPLSIFHP